MLIYDGQMIYNARPRYNLSSEVFRTKIMPPEISNGSFRTDENGEIIDVEEKPTNWGPLVVAAALAFMAMG